MMYTYKSRFSKWRDVSCYSDRLCYALYSSCWGSKWGNDTVRYWVNQRMLEVGNAKKT